MLGLGELINRVSRIVTAVVLARNLTPIELGIAASAIMCFELMRIFAGNGLGHMVVRAGPERLQATCNTAHRLAWAVCLALALLQFAIGAIVAKWSGRTELWWMIACLAGVYLFMPAGIVQAALLQREQRMGTIAGVGTAQICIDNGLTALLALLGLGAWAIVLPKLLTAPIWLIGVRNAVAWKRDRSAGGIALGEVWRFAAPVLASEMLVAARFNVDKLLVSTVLGLEALGVYYFAFSAGYGLSLVLTGALAAASFPHFADPSLSRAELIQRFDRALTKLALPICGLIALQALSIHVYVPVLFGQRWEPHTTLVAVLCLSAVTKPGFDLACQLLRATGQPVQELKAGLAFSVVLLSAFGAALPFGLTTGVAVFAIVSLLMQLAIALWVRWRIYAPPDPMTPAIASAAV